MGSSYPLVSIIVPCYNASKYIDETLDAIASQSYPNIEVVAVDDGSTDDTAERLVRHQGENWRICRLPRNRGARFAYTYGLLHSAGEFVTFLDADDVILPNYVERVLAEMLHTESEIGYANLYVMEGTHKTSLTMYGKPRHPAWNFVWGGPDESFPYGDAAKLRLLVLQQACISPRSIYARRLFYEYGLEDPRLRISHDWLRNVTFILEGAKVVYVDEALGYYRMHPEGNSQRDPIASSVDVVKALNIVLSELRPVMSDSEVAVAQAALKGFRHQLFSALARSDLSVAQIMQWLAERGL